MNLNITDIYRRKIMRTKWYYDRPIADTIVFYDRHLRLWTVYPVDSEGNQLCEADYTTDKVEAQEMAQEFMNIVRFTDIPENVLTEISFMLGSTEECESFYLKPILKRHGYTGEGFVGIDPEDDEELSVDIYRELFLSGMLEPFEED